jgi:hypothetical protein
MGIGSVAVTETIARTEETNTFERTERRLNEWGHTCRNNSDALSLPTVSGIARMIDHVRAQDKKEKRARKKALRRARKAWRSGDEPTDAKLVAEELGYTEKDLTANGKEKRSHREVGMCISSNDLQIDHVVSQLPKWMRETITRSYLHSQPDRRAAQDLRMPKATYRQRRIASVEYVAELLVNK